VLAQVVARRREELDPAHVGPGHERVVPAQRHLGVLRPGRVHEQHLWLRLPDERAQVPANGVGREAAAYGEDPFFHA